MASQPVFPSPETKMKLTYTLVMAGVILLYLQLILGRICRWCGSWVVHKGAEWACKVSNGLSTISLATMPHEHSTVVWTLHLVVLNNSLVAFDEENRLSYLWTNVNVGLVAGSAVLTIIQSGLSGASLWVACTLSAAMVGACAYGKISNMEGSICKLNSEMINKYMGKGGGEVEDIGQDYNPCNMLGYRYLVDPEQRIPVEAIYRGDIEATGLGDEAERNRDVCLSFALFQLLLRLYHKMRCSEAGSQKSKDLVFRRLLPEARHRQRVGFRVIEAELGFLHDHVHGGHVLWSSRDRRVRYRLTVLLRAILMYILIPALYFYKEHGLHDSAAVPVVVALLLLHFFFDLLQIVLYHRSDWWMVKYMCLPEMRRWNRFRQMVATRMHSSDDDYWQNSIGQYSVLPVPADENIMPRPQALFFRRHGGAVKAALPDDDLKASIARDLKRTKGILDGVPSPTRASAQDDTTTQKIKTLLMWHIATCYCDIQTSIYTNMKPADNPRKHAAVVLSRYCAYLLAFRDELLTGIIREREAFNQVQVEMNNILGSESSNQEMRAALDTYRQQQTHNNQTTVTHGLNLGYQLYRAWEDDGKLWRILENVWVKLILSAVAPQYKQHGHDPTAEYHAKYLAKGGEFVTHLWAMLSNAGIQEWAQHHWHRPDEELGHEKLIEQLEKHYDPDRPLGAGRR